MPKERFFTSSPLHGQAEVIISDQEYHHLLHVMRMEEGEEVELVNGQGILAKGTIQRLAKKEGVIVLKEVLETPKPQKNLILYQALPRLQRLDFIVEKGTELGMTHLYLFPGEKSERKSLAPKQIAGLQDQAIAALKQCGRLWMPVIEMIPQIEKWSPFEIPTFYGDLNAKEPLQHQTGSSAVCIGPEAGFSPAELEHLKALGGQGRLLHENILRTETAAIAALVLLGI